MDEEERSMTNRDRAKRAEAALLAHQTRDCNGSSLQARAELAADPAAVLRWVLADVRHWCDANGLAFHEIDRKAYEVYSQEAAEERRAGKGLGAKAR